MRMLAPTNLLLVLVVSAAFATSASGASPGPDLIESPLGKLAISTIPFDGKLHLRGATYTPSGKLLVAYSSGETEAPGQVNLAVLTDDGENFHPIFSQRIPIPPKANGIRFMVFADNRRVFLGDYILECAPSLDTCEKHALLPVEFPEPIASGEHIGYRWSEVIVSPDNQHVAWTTLLSDYSAVVFTGKLQQDAAGYKIVLPRIISTLEAFTPDAGDQGSSIAQTIRGGEVKQFVHGGTAISLVGMKHRVTADSVVQDLLSGEMAQITDDPGYTETTIFSPDEKLGITMSSRFSAATDMAILGLMPRPYPASMEMGFTMLHYTHAVAGVRASRKGSIGPVLIEIEKSRQEAGYLGINLNTEDEWVYHSPMSWHPSGKKALWIEGLRGTGNRRMQKVTLLQYEPQQPVAVTSTPDDIPYALSDLSLLHDAIRKNRNVAVRVNGAHSGYISYEKSLNGALSAVIDKHYVNFSDDGVNVYEGSEKMLLSYGSNSVYTARVKLTGPTPGFMDLKITFGPIRDELPAKLVFQPDAAGIPLSYGYSEYNGKRLSVDELIP